MSELPGLPPPDPGGVSRVVIACRGAMAPRLLRAFTRRRIETVGAFCAADADAPWIEDCTYPAYLGDGEPEVVWSDARRIVASAMDAAAEAVHVGDERIGDHLDLYAEAAAANVGVVASDPRHVSEVLDRARFSSRARQHHYPVIPRSDPLEPGVDGTAAAARIGLPLFVSLVDAPVRARVDAWDQLAGAVRPGRLLLEKVVDGTPLGLVFALDAGGRSRYYGAATPTGPAVAPEAAVAASERLLHEARFVGLARVRWFLLADGSTWLDGVSPRHTRASAMIEAATGVDLVEIQIAVGLGEPLPG